MIKRELRSRSDVFQRFGTLANNREKRSRQGMFFLEGVHPVEQAIKNGYRFFAIGVNAEKRLSEWAKQMINAADPETLYLMDGRLHDELSDRDEPCELVCIAYTREGLPEFDYDPLSLDVVFDRPASPGNLGTVFRSADAFGARSLITTGHASDFYDPRTIRASIGAVFNKPHANMGGCEEAVEYLRSLKEMPLIVGTSARGDVLLTEVDLNRPIAMVIGNETFGMSKAWRESCDVVARIPIHGAASSLNAGSAATVCFYEVARQRSFRSNI